MILKRKLMKFMQGRYGADHLSNFLMVMALLLMITAFFINNTYAKLIINVVVVGILVYSYFRIFSKNHYKRYNENQRYLKLHNGVKAMFKGGSDKQNVRIFKCPGCGVKIRVPKGKGKIAITCPKCHTEFVKKS